nr:hypothetical protein CFP56_03838 [Quercus suber]
MLVSCEPATKLSSLQDRREGCPPRIVGGVELYVTRICLWPKSSLTAPSEPVPLTKICIYTSCAARTMSDQLGESRKRREDRKSQHLETLAVLEGIATLLVLSLKMHHVKHSPAVDSILQDTPLDRKDLACCVSLIEKGVDPEALAVSGHKSDRTFIRYANLYITT